jgi:hypothetical protein
MHIPALSWAGIFLTLNPEKEKPAPVIGAGFSFFTSYLTKAIKLLLSCS